MTVVVCIVSLDVIVKVETARPAEELEVLGGFSGRVLKYAKQTLIKAEQ